jgi:hypothetical protein
MSSPRSPKRSRLGSAPDYLEPAVGWRAWLVVQDGEAIRLSSVIYPTLWPPRREVVAGCRHRRLSLLRPWRRPPPDHGAPEERCHCGIYGARDSQKAAAYLRDTIIYAEPVRWPLLHRAVGRVLLWGSVVECEDGWRASHAYPERLFVPLADAQGEVAFNAGEIARALAVYGVPVEFLEAGTREDMVAALDLKIAA